MSEEKKRLLHHWLSSHSQNRCARLFDSLSPPLKLSLEAEALLRECQEQSLLCLYVLCIGDIDVCPVPIYVGKSSSPLKRWKNGHLRKLIAAQAGKNSGTSYAAWLKLLDCQEKSPSIICLGESDIIFPPIPKFPTTIGSIEYQLISLAGDSYPDLLLNVEGKAR